MAPIALTCAYLGTGCGVIRPLAWPDPEPEPQVIQAAPGKMYGLAPNQWDDEYGRIRLETESAQVAPRVNLDYTVRRRTNALRCRTIADPPGETPRDHARFECVSTSGPSVHFRLAPGVRCPLDRPGAQDTLLNPACWNGVAHIEGQRVTLEHGYLSRTGSPVGYIAWSNEKDALLLAANIVAEMRIETFVGDAPDLHESLRLLTVALSWFQHATD